MEIPKNIQKLLFSNIEHKNINFNALAIIKYKGECYRQLSFTGIYLQAPYTSPFEEFNYGGANFIHFKEVEINTWYRNVKHDNTREAFFSKPYTGISEDSPCKKVEVNVVKRFWQRLTVNINIK